MNPAVHPIPAKADVPVGLIPAPMAVAGQELVALPARLLPAAVVLQVQAEVAGEVPGAAVAHFALTEHAIQVPILIFQNV